MWATSSGQEVVGTQTLHPTHSGPGLASESLTRKEGHTGVCVYARVHGHTGACAIRTPGQTDDHGAGSPEASAGGGEVQWVRIWLPPEGGTGCVPEGHVGDPALLTPQALSPKGERWGDQLSRGSHEKRTRGTKTEIC